MERDRCETKIAVIADLRNLTSKVRNGEVHTSAAAMTLENALESWASIYPDAKASLQEGTRLVACLRLQEDLPEKDVARSLAFVTNMLVESPLAS